MKAFPREVEPQTMKERHVGIESELQYDGGDDWDEVTSQDEDELNKHGLLNNFHHDGGGVEFVTCAIRAKSLKQVKGERYIREYYEFLKPKTTPISSGGTHIHISILNDDHENMEANAVALTVAFYRQFQKIAGRNSDWARQFPGRTLEEVKQEVERMRLINNRSSLGYSRRQYSRGYYMVTPSYHQTLEFRGPKGSNDVDEILAWVDFMENVVRVANRASVDGVKFKQLVKGKRIAEYVKKLKLSSKELNATLNVNALA